MDQLPVMERQWGNVQIVYGVSLQDIAKYAKLLAIIMKDALVPSRSVMKPYFLPNAQHVVQPVVS